MADVASHTLADARDEQCLGLLRDVRLEVEQLPLQSAMLREDGGLIGLVEELACAVQRHDPHRGPAVVREVQVDVHARVAVGRASAEQRGTSPERGGIVQPRSTAQSVPGESGVDAALLIVAASVARIDRGGERRQLALPLGEDAGQRLVRTRVRKVRSEERRARRRAECAGVQLNLQHPREEQRHAVEIRAARIGRTRFPKVHRWAQLVKRRAR